MIIAVTVLFVALASALSELDRISFQFDGFRLLNDLVPRAVIAKLRERTATRYSAMEREYLSDGFGRFCPNRKSELLSRVKFTFSDSPSIASAIAECPGDWSDSQFVGLSEDPEIRRILAAPLFAEVAAQLLGVKAVRFYGDAPFFKDPRQPNRLNDVTPWHRDLFFVPATFDGDAPHKFLTFWCPLDDIGADDALLRFAPGSHGTVTEEIGNLESLWFDDEMLEERFVVQPSTREPTMRAGSCTVHHGALWHSSDGRARGTQLRAAIGFSFIDATARKLDVETLGDYARGKMEQGRQSYESWYNRVAVGDVIDALPVAWPKAREKSEL
jgi:hypothetical protein